MRYVRVQHQTKEKAMTDPKEELIADAEHLLKQIKGDARLWHGEVGLSPSQRETINDWLKEHRKVKSCSSD